MNGDDVRRELIAELARLRAKERAAQSEVERLRQGMWDAIGILGGDRDGDPIPAAVTSDLVTELLAEARDSVDCWRLEVAAADQHLAERTAVTELLRRSRARVVDLEEQVVAAWARGWSAASDAQVEFARGFVSEAELRQRWRDGRL